MFFINYFKNILSQAEKLFDILQCKQQDIKRGQTKTNDFLGSVEYCNDEHYQNILCETAVVTEQENDTAPSLAKRARGA